MRHFTIFINLFVINTCIRVPIWTNDNIKRIYKEVRPTRADVLPHQPYNYLNQQHSANLQPLDAFISSSNNGWNQLLPKTSVKIITSKPKYYKKSIIQMPRKKKLYKKPLKASSTLNNYQNPVPYITYRKPKSSADFFIIPPSKSSNLYNAYPKVPVRTNLIKYQNPIQDQHFAQPENIPPVQNIPKFNQPLYTNLDQSFNIPINSKPDTTFPKTFYAQNQNAEESFVPSLPVIQPQHSNINNYDPVKNNLQGLQNLENFDDFNPSPEVEPNKKIVTPTKNEPEYYSHLYKNYRDDKTHEPEETDIHYKQEEDPEFERDEVEKAPESTHEYPADIPTKPLYPGEGLWAKPGLKHRPFISQQKYEDLKEDKETPKGYDTFVVGENIFDKNKNRFGQNLEHFTQEHNLNNNEQNVPETVVVSTTEKSSEQQNSESSEESEEEEFVPTRLYAQVRATENQEHLPEDDDGRLREAIKESKIHTVYTEEGYEDSAYDHAGHEKEAENDEGFEDLEREKLEKKEKKVPHKKYNLHLPKFSRTKYSNGEGLLSDEEIERLKKQELGLEDADAAGTQFEELDNTNQTDDNNDTENINEDYSEDDDEDEGEVTKPPLKQSNNFISTKETKTMTTKEKDDGGTETEISSKVRIILQPNNSTNSEKYVKVYPPKVYKTINRNKLTLPEYDVSRTTEHENTPVNFSGIFIEEIITTTEIPFTKLPSLEFDGYQDEIPITTLPTTAIPKPTYTDTDETLESINKAFLTLNANKRIKRFTNDFSNLKLEAPHFLPLVSHELGKVEKKDKEKYPYYDNYEEEGINKDSPLRYAENLKNIPKKTGKRMVFYEQADKKVQCPEIEATLNPIPERVSEAEKQKLENKTQEETKDKSHPDKQPKSPRLSGLGNQIDCLKSRYFGKNPFDSPFFEEQTVAPLTPIFNELKPTFRNKKSNNLVKHNAERDYSYKQIESNDIDNDQKDRKYSKKVKHHMRLSNQFGDKTATTQNTPKIIKNEINDQPKKYLDSRKKVYNSNDYSTTPLNVHTISLLTTPKYTVTLKPKHIYHQIELLEYLPDQKNNSKNLQDPKNKPKSSKNSETVDEDNLKFESSNSQSILHNNGKGITKIEGGKIPPFLIFDVNKFLPNQPKEKEKGQVQFDDQKQSITQIKKADSRESKAIDELPEAEELKRRRKIRRKRPLLQIFDVNKFLPTTPSPIYIEPLKTTTVLPKYTVLSEVYYKDDIKPNEQLNVFTDILNNIKNSSNNQAADTSIQSSEPASITFGSKITHKPQYRPQPPKNVQYIQDSYLQAYGDQEIDDSYYSSQITTSTNTPLVTATPVSPVTHRVSPKFHIRKPPNIYTHQGISTPSPEILKDREEKFKLYLSLLAAKKQPKYTSTTTIKNIPVYHQTIPVTEKAQEFMEKTTRVMGLMPPGTQRYKTIHHPKRDNSFQVATPGQKIIRVNKYFVFGMRPPPKQKIIIYADYANSKPIVKNNNILVRGKRSTSRGSYSSLSRTSGQFSGKQNDEPKSSEEDDDYVPHRPKNYYYDEKTGKIVYLTTKKPLQSEEEEIEYEEVTEEPASTTTSKPKQNPIFATATPPPAGKGFLDFVNKLRQAPGYVHIPDPTTTEKGQEEVTQKITTTIKPESTTPPEFLNILAKVRQNSQYKLIEDEDKKKKGTKSSTTTESSEDIVDDNADEEEEEAEQFSQGNIQNSPGGQNSAGAYEQLGIFDVTDFIPKIKNYLPRTSYDITKYKTISRPTVQPASAEEEDDEEEVRLAPTTSKHFVIFTNEDAVLTDDSVNEATATKEPKKVPITLQRRRLTTSVTTTETSTTSTTTTEKPDQPTTKPVIKLRRRPTTLRSTRTTHRTFTTTTTVRPSDSIISPVDKLRRNNYRRRPVRIKNEQVTLRDLDEDGENTTKVLRRRSDTTEQTTPKQGSKFVEAFKRYHRNKKHGGNYRKAENENVDVKEPENSTPVNEKPVVVPQDVEIIADFDKTKRHGGNYKKEEGVSLEKANIPEDYEDADEKSSGTDDKPLLINLLAKDQDQEKNESIENLETDTDDGQSPIASPTKRTIQENKTKEIYRRNKPIIRSRLVNNKVKKPIKTPNRKYFSTEPPLKRLTDIVPKPESYYKDPLLPFSVNMLVRVDKPNSDEISGISSDSAEQIDSDEEVKVTSRDTSSKRPNFIKDPSKRLYYYAPI
ncbi:uncharacterized protein LOC114333241 [Diabrotica virgifera virgifera]|uniref:Titin-like n=1 Tax=Diabrotica virgifera virgifera TaxID=50390 RepID=A0ABM5KPJ9_DIAVI|nr:uncharacterized protein LOC114333241 [Diabrotica virgifera virgifera]